jgi:hypothetical protein
VSTLCNNFKRINNHIIIYFETKFLKDPTFTELIIQLHCITFIDFLQSWCVLYISLIIVKVCSICHLVKSKLRCTRTFHVLIINEDCSFWVLCSSVSVYCFYEVANIRCFILIAVEICHNIIRK